MPWTPNDAERHTHKATTSTLKELWAKVANESLERTPTKVAPSGKQTLWFRGRLKQARSEKDGQATLIDVTSPSRTVGEARPR
jgi:hypothetical protein